MISELVNRKNLPAVTSDRWHVLHARWTGGVIFERAIVSEHDDRRSAQTAALKIHSEIAPEMKSRPVKGRDQILVRHPNYRSLKTAHRAKRRTK